ncbi:MAG TPA: GAF domain-containing protein [Longimicrobium sp.]|nr:GAF domain-containing protein [Longimicrobium sp.]
MEAADESGLPDDIEGVPVVAAVVEALSAAGTLEEGVRLVLAEMGESMGWLFGACWEVDPGRGALRVRQTWCARAYHSTVFETDSRAQNFLPGEGLPGRVWATGAPVWVQDARVEVNFPRHAAAAREGLRAALAFPAQCDGQLYGVLEFYTDWLRAPTPALLPVFERLGEEIGRFMAGHGSAAAPQ